MANIADTFTSAAPGRVRGEWLPETLYLTGDLICIWQETSESFLWVVAKQSHVSDESNKPNLCLERHGFWEKSVWANVSESLTLPEKIDKNSTHALSASRFQRGFSLNSEMLDAFILGKGVPEWYYYDLMGPFKARSVIQRALETLIALRGTILGLKSWLNLIGFDALITRLSPEEYYELLGEKTSEGQKSLFYDDQQLLGGETEEAWFSKIKKILEIPVSEIPLWTLPKSEVNPGIILWKKGAIVSFNDKFWAAKTDIRKSHDFWQKKPSESILWEQVLYPRPLYAFNKFKDNNAILPYAKAWDSDLDIKLGDYIYVNKYHNEDYCGCDLYQAIDNIKFEESKDYPPSPDDFEHWKWIASYKIKNIKEDWTRETTPDNSIYQIEITHLFNRSILADRNRQDRLIYYIKKLMEFLVPAWIRVESRVSVVLQNAKRYRGVIALGATYGVIWPKRWKCGSARIRQTRKIGGYTAIIGTVWPKPCLDREVKIDYKCKIGHYSTTITEVMPLAYKVIERTIQNKFVLGGYSTMITSVSPKITEEE